MDRAAMTGTMRTDFRIGSSRWVRLNDRSLRSRVPKLYVGTPTIFFRCSVTIVEAAFLFAGLQLALQGRKQLGTLRFHDPRRLGRRLGLAEIQLLDAAGALFDLVRRDQDLPDVLVNLAEMVLQFQHALTDRKSVV